MMRAFGNSVVMLGDADDAVRRPPRLAGASTASTTRRR